MSLNLTSLESQLLDASHVKQFGIWLRVLLCSNLIILKYLYTFIVWFYEGAKKEGAAGFFKGIGKGLVGAVAGPTGGIIDMASSTFQGIQR